jgi:tRNA threonylcarbamoyladenosine biosynthesis protein TsaB
MQGLAFASARPLVGVSALDALAHVAYETASWPVVCTWVDAWRGEVYAATYEDRTARDAPVVARPEQLLRDLDRHAGVLFTGGGAAAHRQTIREAMGTRARFTDPLAPMLAGTMGRLAVGAVRRGERPAPHAIRPLYVRRPDAELARAAKADRTIPAGESRG